MPDPQLAPEEELVVVWANCSVPPVPGVDELFWTVTVTFADSALLDDTLGAPGVVTVSSGVVILKLSEPTKSKLPLLECT